MFLNERFFFVKHTHLSSRNVLALPVPRLYESAFGGEAAARRKLSTKQPQGCHNAQTKLGGGSTQRHFWVPACLPTHPLPPPLGLTIC